MSKFLDASNKSSVNANEIILTEIVTGSIIAQNNLRFLIMINIACPKGTVYFTLATNNSNAFTRFSLSST